MFQQSLTHPPKNEHDIHILCNSKFAAVQYDIMRIGIRGRGER